MGLLFFDMMKNKMDMKKAEAAVKKAEKQDNKRFRQEQTFTDRQITISTKAELKDAVSKRYGTIIVVGELTKNVGRAYKVKDKLGLLEKSQPNTTQAGSLATLGITETVIITAIIALTVVLVVAMLKNYSVDTDIEMSETNPKIRLRLNK